MSEVIKLRLIEQVLESALHELSPDVRLKDALAYAVTGVGKRIRPRLCLAFGEELGVQDRLILPTACAIEILHCASLIHDDLPALDNDDFRRGRPSCHKAFDEATALLAGDLLVALATKLTLKTEVDDERKVALAELISNAYIDLCNGQQLDLIESERKSDPIRLYSLKTGALFAAAATVPFVIAGAKKGDDLFQAAFEFGKVLGINFQIRDDELDSSPEKGRVVGSDLRNNRVIGAVRRDVVSPLDALEKVKNEISKSRGGSGSISFYAVIQLIQQIEIG